MKVSTTSEKLAKCNTHDSDNQQITMIETKPRQTQAHKSGNTQSETNPEEKVSSERVSFRPLSLNLVLEFCIIVGNKDI